MNIPVKKLNPNAKIPARSHDTDAGYDLRACISTEDPLIASRVLPPGGRLCVDTGIAISIPKGCYGHICDRSGNALKKGLTVLGGIVDCGYFGSIGVILLNTSSEPVTVDHGDRIAQIIFKKHESPELIEVTDLGDSQRATNGFGSTGK